MDVDCGYCYNGIAGEDFLECEECEQYIHVKCLRRPGTPGDFVGDVFFEFTCFRCTEDHKEIFVRKKMPWSIVIVLSLYNLSKKSQGLSHHGFFHWRTHIAHFIDKNWSYLIDPTTKRRKNWIGTISGALSHHSPAVFTSGFSIFNEAGWWKLTHNINPTQYCELIRKLRDKNKSTDVDVISMPEKTVENELSENESSCTTNEAEKEIFSRTMPYMGRLPHHLVKKEPDVDILDLFESTSEHNILDEMPKLTAEDVNNALIPPLDSINENIFDEKFFNSLNENMSNMEEFSENSEFTPRVIQVTNFQEDSNIDIEPSINIKTEIQSESEDDDIPYEIKYACEKSLFTKNASTSLYPWEKDLKNKFVERDNQDFSSEKEIGLMGEYDEHQMYVRLKKILNSSYNKELEIPHWIRRFYRKLCVRKAQRNIGRKVFNLDKYLDCKSFIIKPDVDNSILDRFHHLLSSNKANENLIQNSRLAGTSQCDFFVSPYTERVLHPFIYRNDSCVPPWVKLMCELQYEVNGEWPSRASIDYCYVRPQHIAAVNALLQRMFWPGIDMSECLTYPDFSIVALYKKLVVGCAFLVPDVGHNEAYVSFMAVRPEWQKSGIATFMLYHLTQACMGKDFTLHVSANNSAIFLYQKFGFRIEKMIFDFYDKFLPHDSPHSKHAFFLRLER